ncbi:MAG: SHOCT domain-containing protein [Haloarculaceae archaeon]
MTDLLGILLQTGPHGPHGPTGPHAPMGPNGGGWGAMPWGAGSDAGLFPTLLWLLVLLAVVAGLAYLAWRLVLVEESSADAPEAMRVLETRYARGEVDDEEFERRRDRLGGEA